MFVQENCISLVDRCDYNVETEWFEKVDKEVADFKTIIYNNLSQVKNVEDKNSVASLSSTSSKRSRKSSLSACERAAEEKARIAELRAESEFLEERRAVGIACEIVRIKQEIAKEEAKVKVFEEFEGSLCSKKSVAEDVQDQNIVFSPREEISCSNIKGWVIENKDASDCPHHSLIERIESQKVQTGSLLQQQQHKQQPQPVCPKTNKDEAFRQCGIHMPQRVDLGFNLLSEPKENTGGTDESTLHADTLC